MVFLINGYPLYGTWATCIFSLSGDDRRMDISKVMLILVFIKFDHSVISIRIDSFHHELFFVVFFLGGGGVLPY